MRNVQCHFSDLEFATTEVGFLKEIGHVKNYAGKREGTRERSFHASSQPGSKRQAPILHLVLQSRKRSAENRKGGFAMTVIHRRGSGYSLVQ